MGGRGEGTFLTSVYLLEHPVNLSEVHLGVGGGAFKSNEVKRLNKEGGFNWIILLIEE